MTTTTDTRTLTEDEVTMISRQIEQLLLNHEDETDPFARAYLDRLADIRAYVISGMDLSKLIREYHKEAWSEMASSLRAGYSHASGPIITRGNAMASHDFAEWMEELARYGYEILTYSGPRLRYQVG